MSIDRPKVVLLVEERRRRRAERNDEAKHEDAQGASVLDLRPRLPQKPPKVDRTVVVIDFEDDET